MRFAGAVLRQTGTVVKAEARLNATLIAISAAPGLVGLAAGADERLVNAVAGLLNLYLQLLSTVRALDVLGFAPPGYQRADMTEGRFGSAFGASLVSTVAIGLGILALIVPGIVLLALWSVWLPAIAGCRLPAVGCRLLAVNAPRRSWRLCRPHVFGLALLLLLVAVGFAVAVGLALLTELAAEDAGAPVADIATELLVSVMLMTTPIVWAAAYGELRRLKADG